MGRFLLAVQIGTAMFAATVSPELRREVDRNPRTTVLVEVQAGPMVYDALRGRLGDYCHIRTPLPTAGAAIVETDGPCLDRLAKDPSIRTIDLPASGFFAAADSLPVGRRHEAIALIGEGVPPPDYPSGSRFPTLAQACFGTCPNGPDSASTESVNRTTETALYRQVYLGNAQLGDGLNLGLVVARVGSPNRPVSLADAIEALDWIHRDHPRITSVYLSIETSQAFCSACDSSTLTNRILASYVKALRNRSVRIFAPWFGPRVRGAPACLEGVERFPASTDPPQFDQQLQLSGTVVGVLQEIQASVQATDRGLKSIVL